MELTPDLIKKISGLEFARMREEEDYQISLDD